MRAHLDLEEGRFEPFGYDYDDALHEGVFLRFPEQWSDASWSGASAEPGYYNVYRWYEAQTGRYSRSDPIDRAGGPYPYAYVLSNPLFYSDPLGLSAGSCPCGSECPGGQWDFHYRFASLYIGLGGWTKGKGTYTCLSSGAKLDVSFSCITVGLIIGVGGGGEGPVPFFPSACGCSYDDLLGAHEHWSWGAVAFHGSVQPHGCHSGPEGGRATATAGPALAFRLPFIHLEGGVGGASPSSVEVGAWGKVARCKIQRSMRGSWV